MDEITNSGSTRWMDMGSTAFTTTATTTDTNCLNLTFNTTWSFLDNYYEWPKGVSDPSVEKKYTPKWHILLGFKNQIKTMWN